MKPSILIDSFGSFFLLLIIAFSNGWSSHQDFSSRSDKAVFISIRNSIIHIRYWHYFEFNRRKWTTNMSKRIVFWNCEKWTTCRLSLSISFQNRTTTSRFQEVKHIHTDRSTCSDHYSYSASEHCLCFVEH